MVLVLTTQSGNPRAGIRFREARRAVARYGVGGAMVVGIGDLSPPRFNFVPSGNRTDRKRFLCSINCPRLGRPHMAEYRAYILDEDGHVSCAIGFVCADDEAAKKYARQFVDGHDVELWQRDRQIATFDCEPE
jgi:hypothetical protein